MLREAFFIVREGISIHQVVGRSSKDRLIPIIRERLKRRREGCGRILRDGGGWRDR